MAPNGTSQPSVAPVSSSGSSKSAPSHGDKSTGQSNPNTQGEPSPTNSTGSFINIDQLDMAVVRQLRQQPNKKERVEPRGFDYTGSTCYRNSLFIMLVCCDRLMSWIQHCHLPSVVAQSERADSGDTTATVMTEFQAFWEIFWSTKPATEANKALKEFWTKCFTGAKVPKEHRWGHAGQNDPTELLGCMIRQLRSQLDDAGLHQDELSFNTMLCTRWTLRNTCFTCSAEKGLKFRSQAAENHDTIQIPLPPSKDDQDGKSPRLEELLHSMVKTDNVSGWECDDCRQQMQDEKATLSPNSKEHKLLMEKWNQRKQSGSRSWNYLRHLPEVLIMQMLRWDTKVDSKGNLHLTKNKTRMELPQEIDLRDMLEPDQTIVPEAQRCNTRYRLVGIVSHAGTKNAGHYINFARSAEGQWCKIDGIEVEPLDDFLQVQADYYYEVGGTRKHKIRELFTPYVLCWERIIDDKGSLPSINSIAQTPGLKILPTSTEAQQTIVLSPTSSSESSIRLNVHEARRPPFPRWLEGSEMDYIVSVLDKLPDDHEDDILNLVKAHGTQIPQDGPEKFSVRIGTLTQACQVALLQYAQRHDPERSVWGRLQGRIRLGGVPINFNLRLPAGIGNFLERTHGKATPPITFDLEEWGLVVPNPYNAGPNEAYYELSTNPPRGTITRDNERNVRKSEKEHTDLWMSLGLERRTGQKFEELYTGKLSQSPCDEPGIPATQETQPIASGAGKHAQDKTPPADTDTVAQTPADFKIQAAPQTRAASKPKASDKPEDSPNAEAPKKPAASTKPKAPAKASTASKKKPTKAPSATGRAGTKRKRVDDDDDQPDDDSEESQSPRGTKRRNTRQTDAAKESVAVPGPTRSTRGATTRSKNGVDEKQTEPEKEAEVAPPTQQTQAKQKMDEEKKRMQDALKGMGRIPKKGDAAKVKQGTKRKASEEVEEDLERDVDGVKQVDRRTKRQRGGRPSGFRDSMGDNMFGREKKGKGSEESDDERPLAEVMRKRRKR